MDEAEKNMAPTISNVHICSTHVDIQKQCYIQISIPNSTVTTTSTKGKTQVYLFLVQGDISVLLQQDFATSQLM